MPARTNVLILLRLCHGMLPIAQCRATPAFGSGHRASTELSFAR